MLRLFACTMVGLPAIAASADVPPSVCGPSGGQVDCDHPDMGTCGNACCTMRITVKDDSLATYKAIKKALKSGVDGTYFYRGGGDPNPADDLRQYKISQPKKYDFILQGGHNCPHYKDENADILNFNIAHTPRGTSVEMFSISMVHGALGDAGQNYKTLSHLIENLELDITQGHMVHGCGMTMMHPALLL
jgi:hypothetical protein